MSGIRSESVNYIGYYSAHEETMKAVIAEQAIAGEERVAGVVRGATVDCRWEEKIKRKPKNFINLKIYS